jgi:hypothetical protein
MNNNQLYFPECGGKKIKIKLAHNGRGYEQLGISCLNFSV